jgi:hypothetical protein
MVKRYSKVVRWLDRPISLSLWYRQWCMFGLESAPHRCFKTLYLCNDVWCIHSRDWLSLTKIGSNTHSFASLTARQWTTFYQSELCFLSNHRDH